MKIQIALYFIMTLISFGTILARPIKALHITFNEEFKNNFEEVAKALRINLTSWFVQEQERVMGEGFWEGIEVGNEIYNIGPRRAKRIWDRHKDFFNTFDVIITSNTTPLSRIFLQNGWTKPLIIWVCNRFDYSHSDGGEDGFPDNAYYELMRKATTMPNVRIVSYTPYERVYAQRKGIEFGDLCIKPLGIKTEKVANFKSAIPTHIDRKETIFVYPCRQRSETYIMESCEAFGIDAYIGTYNGSEDLKDFKGVLYFPHEWSDLLLYEGLQKGIIFFVPSKKFVYNNKHIIPAITLSEFDLCEWYTPGNNNLMVYFDSWQDLSNKVRHNYHELKKLCMYVSAAHRQIMLSKWFTLFAELVTSQPICTLK